MRPTIPFGLVPILLCLPLALAQAQDNINCPDTNLATYLVSLIDVVYNNGLTTFEQVLANLSETDSGYALLESIYTESSLTLLPPTDSAFKKAGINPPFDELSEWQLTSMVSMHLLQGEWDYDKLPAVPMHGVAPTSLKMEDGMNSSVGSSAFQALTMERGDGGVVVCRNAVGNGTTWSKAVDLSGTELTNLVILPVDTVLSLPPNLSTALTLPATSRSALGVTNLTAALSVLNGGGLGSLQSLTQNGFTIFAPVDDAWTAEIGSSVKDKTVATKLLQNHYTTNYSLFSPAWSTTGKFPSLQVDSGESLSVKYNGTGNYVTLGNQTAMILRSDVVLENGVMHIINQVLTTTSTTASTSSTGPPASATSVATSSTGDQNGDEAGNTNVPPQPTPGAASGKSASGASRRISDIGVVVLGLAGTLLLLGIL